MSMTLPPVAVHAGEGQELPSPTGDRITVKVGTGETGGWCGTTNGSEPSETGGR